MQKEYCDARMLEVKRNWIKIVAVVIFLFSFGRILTRNLPQILSASAPDFTQVWLSAKALTISREPYLNAGLNYPNAYPPVTEIFFLPLALLKYHQALAVFTFFSFASTIGSVYLSLKIVIKKVPWDYFLLYLGLALLSFPARFSLGMGQVNMLVLFMMLLAIFLETKPKKNSLWAGVVFGITLCIKPIFAFFLLFFAIKKSWNLIIISLLTVSLLVGATFIVWSPGIWSTWYKTGILPLTNYTSPQIYVYPNQGVFGFLYRIVPDFNLRIFMHKAITVFLVFIATFTVFKKKDYSLGLSLFIITLLLFDLTSWQHHFVWAIFTFVALSHNVIKVKKPVLLGLICVAYLLISWNFKQPVLHPVMFLSTQFYGAIILWLINLYLLNTDLVRLR